MEQMSEFLTMRELVEEFLFYGGIADSGEYLLQIERVKRVPTYNEVRFLQKLTQNGEIIFFGDTIDYRNLIFSPNRYKKSRDVKGYAKCKQLRARPKEIDRIIKRVIRDFIERVTCYEILCLCSRCKHKTSFYKYIYGTYKRQMREIHTIPRNEKRREWRSEKPKRKKT